VPIRASDLGSVSVILGCGLAGSARIAAKQHPRLEILGLTLVPWQVAESTRLVAAAGVAERVRVVEADFTVTGLPAASFDGAWTIESACHDGGDGKEGFVREAARLLRPGARLVVADGFLIGRGGAETMSVPLRALYRRICRHWALESFARLDAFVAALSATASRRSWWRTPPGGSPLRSATSPGSPPSSWPGNWCANGCG
jgi:SAM-dependent methyltransferase